MSGASDGSLISTSPVGSESLYGAIAPHAVFGACA